jgi:hypothetical protein
LIGLKEISVHLTIILRIKISCRLVWRNVVNSYMLRTRKSWLTKFNTLYMLHFMDYKEFLYTKFWLVNSHEIIKEIKMKEEII